MKITIDPNGPSHLYSLTVPAGSLRLGTITRNGYDTGALVRLANGRLVQVNTAAIRNVPPGVEGLLTTPDPIAPAWSQDRGTE